MKIVSTVNVEYYDNDSVRVDYPVNVKTITISEKNNDIFKIVPWTTGEAPTPRTINLVATGCEYLAIFTDNPVTITLNGADMVVTSQFIINGTGINTLTITNSSTTLYAIVNVIVGNTI